MVNTPSNYPNNFSNKTTLQISKFYRNPKYVLENLLHAQINTPKQAQKKPHRFYACEVLKS